MTHKQTNLVLVVTEFFLTLVLPFLLLPISFPILSLPFPACLPFSLFFHSLFLPSFLSSSSSFPSAHPPSPSYLTVLKFKELHKMSDILRTAGLTSDTAFTITEHFTNSPCAKSNCIIFLIVTTLPCCVQTCNRVSTPLSTSRCDGLGQKGLGSRLG